MPFKTSWLNKELMLQIARSTGWISIVYFLVLLFAVPLRMMMMYTDEYNKNNYGPVNSLFQYDFVIQLSLLIVVPVLLAVFLFRFLQMKQSAEFMHSLSIKREKIFHHYALSGFISLVFPVILVALIVIMVHSALDLNPYFQMKDVFYWAGTTLIIDLLLYTAGIFVAMMTGISAVQGVLTYILLLFPAGITLLTLFNIKMLLFGFPSEYYLNRNLETMSPITYAALLDGRHLQRNDVILYAMLTVILYVLSLYFYKKRKVESASEAIAFPKLRSIFKYGVTFCMMLLGGMYFGEVQNNSLGWMIFGSVVGSVIGYYIAEMLLQKTWRVFSKIKGLFIYGVTITILVLGIQALGFYENHIPDQDEIKNVLLADSPYVYMDPTLFDDVFNPIPLKEQDNIEAVRKLHQQIVKDKEINMELEDSEYTGTAFFRYELKNGEKVIRQYLVNQKVYEDLYRPIYESEEYKRASNEIFQLDANQIDYLTINANGPGKRNVTINDSEDLKEIIEVIQSDVLAESYEERVYFSGRRSMIEIFIEKDRFLYMDFKPTYTGLNQWLNEKGLLDQAKVMPEDVASIQIAKWDKKEFTYPEQIVEEMENLSDVLEIADKGQIGEVLNNAGWGRSQQYIAVLHFEEGGYKEALYLDQEHAPEFIKNYFK